MDSTPWLVSKTKPRQHQEKDDVETIIHTHDVRVRERGETQRDDVDDDGALATVTEASPKSLPHLPTPTTPIYDFEQ